MSSQSVRANRGSRPRLRHPAEVPSVGSRGDSYDNALAETIIGLYKAEPIRRRGPWKSLDEVEYATWSGSTGSTTAGSWNRSATSRQQSSRPPPGASRP
jgi:transposase InsO family protein